jgi:hypothetical protein
MLSTSPQRNGLPTALTVEQSKVGAELSRTTGTITTVAHTSTSGTKPLHYGQDDVRRKAHEAYRVWHRGLGSTCFAWDCDLIEGRRKRRPDGTYENGVEPVCLTETTSVATAANVNSDRYLSFIWERMEAQMRFLEKLALMAGIKFYVIVYDYAFTRFAVYEPRTKTTTRQSQEEHATWLRSLEVANV